MKKKKLYPVLTILVFVVFFSITLTSCEWFAEDDVVQIIDKDRREAALAEKVAEEEAERIAKEEEKQAEEAVEESTEEVVEDEEENLIPNESITYSGSIDGVAVILIVNFKTTEVTGSISKSGDDYIDATISGKIDIDTFEVTSNYSGIYRSEESDQEVPFNGTITGKITNEISTFNGIILPDYEDSGTKFTATK